MPAAITGQRENPRPDISRAWGNLGGSALLCFFESGAAGVERRVVCIVVFGVEIFLYVFQRLAESLKMDDFALTQELERVAHIRVVDQTEQVVVAQPRLLFWYACIRTNLSEK